VEAAATSSQRFTHLSQRPKTPPASRPSRRGRSQMTRLSEIAKQNIATSHKLVEDAIKLREENRKLIKEAQDIRIKIAQSFSQRSDTLNGRLSLLGRR